MMLPTNKVYTKLITYVKVILVHIFNYFNSIVHFNNCDDIEFHLNLCYIHQSHQPLRQKTTRIQPKLKSIIFVGGF